MEGLGIQIDELKLITSEIQVVINCAASVDFNLQLD